MREIKFRAWDIQQKRMIPVDMIYFRGHSDDTPQGDKRRVGYMQDFGYNVCYDFELMQYTGLKDKNGKEIYEGDIIKRDGEDWVDEVIFNPCMQLKDGGECLAEQIEMIGDEIEVIGNIWENGDLLK